MIIRLKQIREVDESGRWRADDCPTIRLWEEDQVTSEIGLAFMTAWPESRFVYEGVTYVVQNRDTNIHKKKIRISEGDTAYERVDDTVELVLYCMRVTAVTAPTSQEAALTKDGVLPDGAS